MIEGESPHRRVSTAGLETANSIDLLAVALSAKPEESAARQGIAREIIQRYRLHHLRHLTKATLAELAGIDEWFAERLLCTLELGRRTAIAGRGEIISVNSPSDVFERLAYMRDLRIEQVVLLCLDTQNGIIAERVIHIGTLNRSLVGLREIFHEAITERAAQIILVHNHPSGNTEPSPEDISITRKIKETGDMLDIPLVDHIIIGHLGWCSLREKGVL